MSGARVLITGNNGYIGTVMGSFLLARGHDVAGLDTDFFEPCTFGDDIPRIPTVRRDIRDVVRADLEGFDAVVHLAALSNDPLGEVNSRLTYDINHLASVRLATLARAAGVRRFLYSSSCSMYGAAGETLVDEDAPLAPITPYAISKVRTEADVSGLATDRFSPVFLRNATVYGVSPRLRADLVLNNLAGWAATTGRIRILSDGTPWRPVVHVEDVARAFAAALEAPAESVHDQAFNVGRNSENHQVRDLAEFVRDIVPECRVEYAEGGGPDPRSYRVNFGKIGRLLPGFQPAWTARSGAEELHEAFRKHALRLEDFQGRRYVRIAQLKHLLSTNQIDDEFRWTKG